MLHVSGGSGTFGGDSYGGLYGDTYARMVFTYVGNDPDNTITGMGVRIHEPAGPNNYGYVVELKGTATDEVTFEFL